MDDSLSQSAHFFLYCRRKNKSTHSFSIGCFFCDFLSPLITDPTKIFFAYSPPSLEAKTHNAV